MLPFEQKSWARTVAGTVIGSSLLGSVCLALYFRSIGSLHISEVVGIFLLLLTIIPPNVAVLTRKSDEQPLAQQGHLRGDTPILRGDTPTP